MCAHAVCLIDNQPRRSASATAVCACASAPTGPCCIVSSSASALSADTAT